jgi:two-component system sensor kinase FixL
MGELVSSLAHELNQPLGAILRNAEAGEQLLQQPSPDLDEVRAIMSDIVQDDQRAGMVIDRLRSMLKRREVEHSVLDLSLLAGGVANLVRPEADSRKVELTLDVDSPMPPVLGDRVQLQQVLLNLLLNAMDAVHDSAPDRRRVTLRVQNAGAQIEVEVSDTGHGIPADKLQQVFTPFFTTKPNGLGMGLPISRSIIESHDGKIWAANNAQGGATFIFTLPVAAKGKAN